METSLFLSSFTIIDTYEDCPVDCDLIVWDGCDFSIEYVSYCSDTGSYYPANGFSFIAFYELPCQDEAVAALGEGE